MKSGVAETCELGLSTNDCTVVLTNSIRMEGNQILVKLLSIGDKEVGKSCIIKRYCEGRFVQKYITTIGVDYGVKKMTISGKKIAVNFFDLSGDDDYALIRNPFIKDAQVQDGAS